HPLEIGQLALGAAPLDAAVDQRGDAGAVVAAVLQALERVEQEWSGRLAAENANNATHRNQPPNRLCLAGPPRPQPRRAVGDVGLPAARDAQAAGRHVAIDRAAGPDHGAVADGHRRDQRRVRADEGAGADVGTVFGKAVVVAHDRAGADVGLGADPRVAEVGQVIGLGARLERRVLDLDEIADLGPGADLAVRAKARERPDLGTLADRDPL